MDSKTWEQISRKIEMIKLAFHLIFALAIVIFVAELISPFINLRVSCLSEQRLVKK